MAAAKSGIVAGGNSIVIAHIGILVITDHRIGAALLRTGHADGAAGHLDGRGVYAHGIHSLRCGQPVLIRRHSHQQHSILFLHGKSDAKADLIGAVHHLRSFQHKDRILLRVCTGFI